MSFISTEGATAQETERLSGEAWKKAVRFDSLDAGWIIISIGMAIGAGIVFLPVQAGLVGIWAFLASSVIAYPSLFLFQRLFINTLVDAQRCEDYPGVIAGYLGRNWAIPAWLVFRVSALKRYRNVGLIVIVITGILLLISPFLNFTQ